MSKKKVEKELEVKTCEEWAKELYENEGIEILDPDGFRNEPQDTYTKEEFNKRLLTCTILQKITEKEFKEMNDINKGIEKMKKSLVGETERLFTNIKKLKCDYTTYKEERTKYNMPVETNCSKCEKIFESGEEIYTAFEEGKQGSQIICGNCAK
ncbi:MAG: hypothetical protein HFJ30_00215 [Clostridia bacterium]|jgi:hypothetical protein|nr:hypothetical protein [Clostridia bacterium]